ncbi:Uncharacterised protein [Sphingobacterium daejeonense]|nr:Uncharacterised protein [Sphingobacterium daejeonense]
MGTGKDVKLTIKEGDNSLSSMAKPNGKVTVEPNETGM